MQITTIDLDLAKNVFHVVCCNAQNRVLKRKVLKRQQVLNYLARVPACLVAMEACSTSNYWAREIAALGHKVKLLPPQHVKAFLTGNKNDFNDALAIVVASQQSHIKSVEVKTEEQQDSQTLHKMRELAVRQRTALCNQIRNLMSERGIILKPGIQALKCGVSELLGHPQRLSGMMKTLLHHLYSQLTRLEDSIAEYNKLIQQEGQNNDICQRLQSIPGIGSLVASALFNEIGNGSAYKKGRDVSASLGLVPKQYSSGGKDRLLGISKRGNRYLRCLLILGAKAVVSRAKHKTDPLSLWINRLVAQRGHNKACVAYANKMARMAWAITVSGELYQPA
ncbi:IS110 family transposase [Paraneptunicella aestuarii]|uniref:IS110 family transposase n=1 Tax=Paraneptunicella aestuarii TaxID=2831148 RepID=UPI001E398999|nr:IS110 family transposase [Paraneptunicella aestuarii]UAA38173.1 IS110 family transposase [Paraneptunicella aestuarii]